MSRYVRRTAVLAPVCALAIFASSAQAYITHDISGITLTESYSYISPFEYHISSGTDGEVAFRWLDAPGKDTTIQAVGCIDTTELGHSNFSAGATGFQTLFNGFNNECFELRGRTQAGQGTMANPHSGRVRH
jgi:hypothetical protein